MHVRFKLQLSSCNMNLFSNNKTLPVVESHEYHSDKFTLYDYFQIDDTVKKKSIH